MTTDPTLAPSHSSSRLTPGLILVALLLRCVADTRIVSSYQWSIFINQLVMHIVLCLLIYVNRKELLKYHFNRFTLIIFVLFRTLLYSTYHPPIYYFLELLIYTSTVIILVRKLKQDPDYRLPAVRKSQVVWFLICILVGCALGALQTWLHHTVVSTSQGEFLVIFIQTFCYSISIPAITEDPLFRGFLWGYLRDLRFKELPILLIQAGLFSLIHVGKWNSAQLLIETFILGVIFGIIAHFARSVAPVIATHAGFDGVVYAVFIANQ